MLKNMKIKIFADGANYAEMIDMNNNKLIDGLTTNPSLMKKAGINNYEKFAKQVLNKIKKKTISFEVFSDDLDEMIRQAIKIDSWGNNVFVKIPITNSKGKSTKYVVNYLIKKKIKTNITAIFSYDQVEVISKVLDPKVATYVSIFAGRIADTGRDPVQLIKQSLKNLKIFKKTEIIWASCRELINIFQANQAGTHIITVPSEILKKIKLINYNLKKYSLETVNEFYNDSIKAGFKL